MRLGGPIFQKYTNPEEWIQAVKQAGYRAALCPVGHDADDAVIEAYRTAAVQADIVIAEVGAWSNPISPDPKVRAKAMEHCKKQLALADKLGARCCVNIAGSRGEQWDGPHPENFSDETFQRIVEAIQEIIDAVNPSRTFYTLETMPWIYPDSADSYLRLIEAVNRDRFAVHFDPVNMINSPRIFYDNGPMIRDFCSKLGPYLKNCHAKDIELAGKLTVHLDEVLPGTGGLDYDAFLDEMNKLDPDTPIIVEHLSTEEEYNKAASFIRSKAASMNFSI